MTPGYPSLYTSNITCRWLITVPQFHQIKLKFYVTAFSGVNCTKDNIKMIDGEKTESFCSKNLPSEIYSKSTKIEILLLNDMNEEYNIAFKVVCYNLKKTVIPSVKSTSATRTGLYLPT